MTAPRPADVAEVAALVDLVCHRVGSPDAAARVRVYWTSKMRSRIGEALPVSFRLRLSVAAWRRASREQRRDAVVQGVAHLLVRSRRLRESRSSTIDDWRRLVWLCGASSRRDHAHGMFLA